MFSPPKIRIFHAAFKAFQAFALISISTVTWAQIEPSAKSAAPQSTGNESPATTRMQATGPSSAIAPPAPPSPPSHLVRELLEADAKRALAEERAKGGAGANSTPAGIATILQGSSAPADTASSPPASPVQIVSITGVGNNLIVRLERGGKAATYRAGVSDAVQGADLGLVLQAISPPCATFRTGSDEVTRYCIGGLQ